MDQILERVGVIFRNIFNSNLSRYHLTALLLLLILKRHSEFQPSEYLREFYYKLRFAPTPTKLLTWPIRLALCFLLALPNMPDFPMGLIVCDQYIFPFLLLTEVISFTLLGIHMSNYCSKNGSLCYYSTGDNHEEITDFHSSLFDGLLQIFITTHIVYVMWLIKSMRHIILLAIREALNWFVRLIPKVIPLCRVILLIFAFNLQDTAVLILFVYMTCKICMDRWFTALVDRPFTMDGGTVNANNQNSSEPNEELEDVVDPSDNEIAA